MSWWAVGTAVVGMIANSDSQRSASNKANDATKAANAAAMEQYNQTRTDNMPALESRNWALDQLKQRLATPITAQNVTSDPGYQFGMDQGMQQLTRAMNAKGMRNSGSMLQAATQYGNDYGTTKFGEAINRRNVELSPLQSLAGLGQTGASTIAGAGQNYANAFGNNVLNNANFQGAAGVANANMWGNTANQLAGWYANQNRNQGSSNGFNGNGWSYNDYANGG